MPSRSGSADILSPRLIGSATIVMLVIGCGGSSDEAVPAFRTDDFCTMGADELRDRVDGRFETAADQVDRVPEGSGHRTIRPRRESHRTRIIELASGMAVARLDNDSDADLRSRWALPERGSSYMMVGYCRTDGWSVRFVSDDGRVATPARSVDLKPDFHTKAQASWQGGMPGTIAVTDTARTGDAPWGTCSVNLCCRPR